MKCEDVDKVNFITTVALVLVQGGKSTLEESTALHTSQEQLLEIWLLKAEDCRGE